MKLRAVLFLMVGLAGGLGPAQAAPSNRPPVAPPTARPPAPMPAARPPAALPAARPAARAPAPAPARAAAQAVTRPAAARPAGAATTTRAASPAVARSAAPSTIKTASPAARPSSKKTANTPNNQKKLYRYVSEGEKRAIEKSGRIPNTDAAGKPKQVYYTDRPYTTAGRAKTHNQLPAKPAYRVEIDPKAVKSKRPMQRVDPKANPQWGKGGGVESKTGQSIKVDPSKIRPLKGAPTK